MEMTTNITFSPENVLPLRSKLGLTQTELADRLGVSQPLVARWEAGNRVPSGPAAILLKQLEKQTPKKSAKSC